MAKRRSSVWTERPVSRSSSTLPKIRGDRWALFRCHADQHRSMRKLAIYANPKVSSTSIECWCPGNLCPASNGIFHRINRFDQISCSCPKITVIKMHSVPKCFEMLYCTSFLKTVSFSTSSTYLASVVNRSIAEVQCGSRIPSMCSEQSMTMLSGMWIFKLPANSPFADDITPRCHGETSSLLQINFNASFTFSCFSVICVSL